MFDEMGLTPTASPQVGGGGDSKFSPTNPDLTPPMRSERRAKTTRSPSEGRI